MFSTIFVRVAWAQLAEQDLGQVRDELQKVRDELAEREKAGVDLALQLDKERTVEWRRRTELATCNDRLNGISLLLIVYSTVLIFKDWIIERCFFVASELCEQVQQSSGGDFGIRTPTPRW